MRVMSVLIERNEDGKEEHTWLILEMPEIRLLVSRDGR